MWRRDLDFIKDNPQARIVIRHAPDYQFFQYGDYAGYQVARPINTHLMYSLEELQQQRQVFGDALVEVKAGDVPGSESRQTINRFIPVSMREGDGWHDRSTTGICASVHEGTEDCDVGESYD